jgi:hypothetical protein
MTPTTGIQTGGSRVVPQVVPERRRWTPARWFPRWFPP